MSLSKRTLNQLKKIVELANKMLANAESAGSNGSAKSNGTKQKSAKKSAGKKTSTRTRRTGAELVSFRKMLVAERKKGTSVADLSKLHGVSPAYIYQL
jgi:hypothetical protein